MDTWETNGDYLTFTTRNFYVDVDTLDIEGSGVHRWEIWDKENDPVEHGFSRPVDEAKNDALVAVFDLEGSTHE